jgi:hypothetical protein
MCNLNGTNLLIKKAHSRGGVKTNWSSSSFFTIVFVAVPTYRLSNHLYLHDRECNDFISLDDRHIQNGLLYPNTILISIHLL